jgi:signal transduction histidine kinase
VATRNDQEIRLGVLRATPAQLAQIKQWGAAFRQGKVSAEAVNGSISKAYDLYLLFIHQSQMEQDTAAQVELAHVLPRVAHHPCLALTASNLLLEDNVFNEAVNGTSLVDKLLAAGVTDFLAMPNLDAVHFEQAVHLRLRRRQVLARQLDEARAREQYLAAARERDRQQLANALHDGPLQDLIGARLLLGALATDDAAADIQNSLQSVIQTVRSLCSELKPPAMAPFGLEKAMRAYLQAFQTRNAEITTKWEFAIDQQQLPEWARFALFRVFQAAIANVDRHAQASQLQVNLVLDDGTYQLTIVDNGQGFVVPGSWLDFAPSERYGLLMMQERVDALQGQMVVQSTPGNGVRVMVQVPFDQPPVPLPAHLPSIAPDRNG